MSKEAMSWALSLDLRPTTKFILAYLANLANDNDECWPRVRVIAERCNVSERTVQRALKEFQALGLISVTATLREDGSQSSNCYRLNIQTDSEDLSPPHDAIASPPGDSIVSPSPDTSDTPGVTQLCQGGGDTAMSPHNTQTNTKLNTQLLQAPRLKYPPQLNEFERTAIQKQLSSTSDDIAQMLLDELTGAIESQSIKTTRIRWFRGIIQSHKQGTFVPSAGIDIAHRRKLAQEQRETRHTPSRDPKQRSQHANHHLTAIRELIKSATDD